MTTIFDSILVNTDSYKASMLKQYPEGTTNIFSYIESRGGKYRETVFFGLQAFIKEYLLDPITEDQNEFAKNVWEAHGEPYPYEEFKALIEEKGGVLPVVIKALPEGSIVPTHTALVTIELTEPDARWVSIVTWLETALLRAVWYPTTVATNSYQIKKLIANNLKSTGDLSGLPFKLHDFGARGASSKESAMLGGMAHLVNFMGTDTIGAVIGAMKYYNAGVCGFSIPAAEHSTITSWGKENEAKAYRNMLKQFAKPGSLVAVVSDSYDIYNAVENIWGGELKQEVIKSGATVVIRPDSGDPVEVVTRVAELLDAKFKSKLNDRGYKVLNNVRIIQGDGINAESIKAILDSLRNRGFSGDNIAFGMGGALLQGVTRDDQKFAMKCSAALVNGVWRDVFKDPITDHGKKSKAGRLDTVIEHGLGSVSFRTVPEGLSSSQSALREVYRNGKLLIEEDFETIRARAKI